jgi:glyoxylase-like metal-dependent hydrolase (beta-lactamase superfamily II)
VPRRGAVRARQYLDNPPFILLRCSALLRRTRVWSEEQGCISRIDRSEPCRRRDPAAKSAMLAGRRTRAITMADEIDFDRNQTVAYGAAEALSPLIRRVVANNPSPFTFKGTGTYLIGTDDIAVIDPGPLSEDHLAALLAALGGARVSQILVTHTHIDHSPLAAPLQAKTGAPILGFGPHPSHGTEGELGGDAGFMPDRRLADGEIVDGAGWTLQAIHTPGHASNHLCFALREEAAIFTGDHIMGWSTTVVSPPDGDMALYMASLDKLKARPERLYIPCHGPAIADGPAFARSLLGHRRQREAQILRQLDAGPGTVPALVERIYRGLDPRLIGAAGRSVTAHLVKLEAEGKVAREDGAYRVIRN